MIAARHEFPSRGTLAKQLAIDVSRRLPGVVAVSGGTTPRWFFKALSRIPKDWQRSAITLVDERRVHGASSRSNARLVRETLLRNKMANTRFLPLIEDGEPKRFAAVVLGMGLDGHTASLFPGGDRLAEALDPKANPAVIPMVAPGAPEPRISLNLAAILATGFLALHIEGKDKRKTLELALEDGPVEEMPIRAVLRGETPVHLYWCP